MPLKRQSSHSLKQGFTLLEIIAVVAIIAILATIAAVSLSSHLTKSRDSQRRTSAEMIASALEKYYLENGEYPGCAAITQPGNSVSQGVLKGLDNAALVTPNSSEGTTNSIVCDDINNSEDDVFAYVGDNTAACKTGPACSNWTISYRDEASGEVKTIFSRH